MVKNVNNRQGYFYVRDKTVKKERPNRLEGFWYSKSEPDFPKPKANKKAFDGKKEFLKSLRKLQSKLGLQRFKGYSPCRLCDKNENGSGEYNHNGWTWPEGFEHYVDVHNVKPSDDFIAFILGGGKKTKKPEYDGPTDGKGNPVWDPTMGTKKPKGYKPQISTLGPISDAIAEFAKNRVNSRLANDFAFEVVRDIIPKFCENYQYSSGAASGFWIDSLHKFMIKYFEEKGK